MPRMTLGRRQNCAQHITRSTPDVLKASGSIAAPRGARFLRHSASFQRGGNEVFFPAFWGNEWSLSLLLPTHFWPHARRERMLSRPWQVARQVDRVRSSIPPHQMENTGTLRPSASGAPPVALPRCSTRMAQQYGNCGSRACLGRLRTCRINSIRLI